MENNNTKKKKTLGQQKIEIKKIEDQTRLRITLAKRRRGLFKKASELVLLCGAEVAIVVESPSEKIYTFEAPSVEALVNRVSHDSPVQIISTRPLDDDGRICKLEYEEVARRLKEEEGRMMSSGGGCWWEEPIDGLNLQQLEEYLAALEGLREDVENKITTAAVAPLSIQDYGFGCGASTSTVDQDFGFDASTSSYDAQDLFSMLASS